MKEAIILAGGQGLRLKGAVDIPKPFLVVKQETGETLFDAQLKWLIAHDFEHVILTLSRENFKYMRTNYPKLLNEATLDFAIEENNLGTAGALKNSLDYMEKPTVYCLNVDDVCFYSPIELFDYSKGSNVILVKQATLPFGVVKFDSLMRVTSFVEKPQVESYVSCGHYLFKKRDLEDLLPDEGDLERTLLTDLARLGMLNAYILKGKWTTLNTYKDLVNIRKGNF